MSHTLSTRVPDELARKLKDASERTGLSQGEIVRQFLEKGLEAGQQGKPFMRLAGKVDAPPDLSSRRGFER